MNEVIGNLWDFPADVRVITTNGTVKKNGEVVMGRGCAKEAKDKYPWLPKRIGKKIQNVGNRLFIIYDLRFPHGEVLITFPVKYNWWDQADLGLIEVSCAQLEMAATLNGFKKIVMPRPGCGNGKLSWEEVKPILQKYLDDRFYVITYE